MAKKPSKATIWSFNVGFGDCFLLIFHYSDDVNDDRRILIDFGSTAGPKQKTNATALAIANKIKELSNDKLHVVVATHRHADHISGFATNAKGTASGDIIAGLKPDLVLQPWTEEPGLPAKATEPTTPPSAKKFALRLQNIEKVADSAAKQAGHLNLAELKADADQIKFIGMDNISNESAIRNLAKMAKKNVYAHADMPLNLAGLLPGVDIRVLGPPTVKQWPDIQKQRSKDAEEFWHLQAASGEAVASGGFIPDWGKKAVLASLPIHARWFVRRMRTMQASSLYGLVRALDDQMNNTSLILLFTAGRKKLLFPGDAQWENWSYSLGKPETVKLLEDIDVLKVGHHGSLNATPKKHLWGILKKVDAKKDRLVTLLSTRADKHGKVASKTEVPRSTLLQQLDAKTDLTNTQEFEDGVLCKSIVVDLT